MQPEKLQRYSFKFVSRGLFDTEWEVFDRNTRNCQRLRIARSLDDYAKKNIMAKHVDYSTEIEPSVDYLKSYDDIPADLFDAFVAYLLAEHEKSIKEVLEIHRKYEPNYSEDTARSTYPITLPLGIVKWIDGKWIVTHTRCLA